jgi:hypothetical protein
MLCRPLATLFVAVTCCAALAADVPQRPERIQAPKKDV